MTSPTAADLAEDGHGDEGVQRFEDAGLTAEPIFLMARAASVGSSDANRRLARLGLKVRSYSVLAVVAGGRAPTQRELSQFLVMNPSQVVAILDDLEERGLVQRRTDPRDRRSKIIVPTEAGRKLCAQAKDAVDTAAEESLGALGPQEREELSRLLRKVAF